MIGALVGGLGVLILTLPIPVQTLLARVWAVVAGGALTGGLWGFWNWQIILKYIYQIATGIRDPILQRDTGFYLRWRTRSAKGPQVAVAERLEEALSEK